jgi:hypothetical protein
VQVDPSDNRKVRCYVRGCEHYLRPASRGSRGEVCPSHGIWCFSSKSGATYGYANAERNVIVSRNSFRERVLNHPMKFESHRLGLERSEDTLTWNVFKSFQEAGQLHRIASSITGTTATEEPMLLLWGIRMDDGSYLPWQLLLDARRRFERNLPVDRPLTEPDIALHLPGRYLILIEAKFTSPNSWVYKTRRANAQSLTGDECIDIYDAPELATINRIAAKSSARITGQLYRNMVFAEWMARADSSTTEYYHANLVRADREQKSATAFSKLLNAEHAFRFQQFSWESIYGLAKANSELSNFFTFMENKTAGLRPAFKLR